MPINIKDGITYDDVLLIPNYSTISSRKDIDISIQLGKFKFSNPIIPANMKTVSGLNMVMKIISTGGLAILHRFMSDEDQFDISKKIIELNGSKQFAVSIGIKDHDKYMVNQFVKIGVEIVCIDIAHGDSKSCIDMITWIKFNHPNLFIIAGNVATGKAAYRLWDAGADVVKVGVGPGSLCTTRIETGNGVPQLSALIEVYETQQALLHEQILNKSVEKREFQFIADGGIKNAGDIVKALCFADMVMVGNLFAGTDEAPGDTIEMNGRSYKRYVGSSTHKANHIEGIEAMVPYKGPVSNVLTKLLEGLRSGMSYQNAHNLIDLKDNPQFIRITNAGLKESHPHDVLI